MHTKIRNFRGCKHANLNLQRIALVGGMNGQGKSSIAQAVRAGLCQLDQPLGKLVPKGKSSLLVHHGADVATVQVEDDKGGTMIEWPANSITTLGDDASESWASSIAAGIGSPADLSTKELSSLLAGTLGTMPVIEDLARAMEDIGYGEKAVQKMWDQLKSGGWDDAHKRASEYGTRLKGSWEEVTGEKWGVRKGASWGNDAPDIDPDIKKKEIRDIEARIESAIAASAVDKSRLEELKARSTEIGPAKTAFEKAEADAKEKRAEYNRLNTMAHPPLPPKANQVTCCPECGTVLKLENDKLVKDEAPEEVSESERQNMLDAYNHHAKLVNDALEVFEEASKIATQCEQKVTEARRLKIEYDELCQAARGDASLDVDQLKSQLADAKDQLAKTEARDRAATIHAEIKKNLKVAEILAPDGLRQEKLSQGLDELNTKLADLCKQAKWPNVVVRSDMSIWAYNVTSSQHIPYSLCSESEKYRVRVILQIAFAQMDGSSAVIIDAADVLDQRGRNGLFAMLSKVGISALVCMTVNTQEKLPDLAKAKLGHSYWIEGGQCVAVEE